MTEFARSLAVVIGINNYQNGIDTLQTAVPDAIAIAEILQKTYKYRLIHPDFDAGVIVNQYATKNKLKTLLTDVLPNKIKPTKRDRLIFYFAGHGIARNSDDEPQGFLVPQDGKIKDCNSLLKMSDVHDWLANLDCKHLLIILDCCFAGAFRWASYRKLIPVTAELTKAHYDRFIKFDAWQVLTSASHDQEALEFLNNRDIEPDDKHSPFAEGLIEALQQGKGDINNDGVIIATELYQYLRDYVEKNSKDRQTPGLFPLKKHDRGEYLFKLPDTPLNLKETPELNKENNPYRGLEPFEPRHSELFFGRDKVIQKLYRQISHVVPDCNQLTVVTGISGSGKSSLVKAGLIPYLEQNQPHKWLILDPIRPGTNPYAALARVLSQLDSNLSKPTSDTKLFGQQIQDNSNKFIKAIQAWSQQNPHSRLLLVIDQFEELITMNPKAESKQNTLKSSWLQKLSQQLGWLKTKFAPEQSEPESQQGQEFIELLVAILQQCPQLSLVITLRSDFEPRFQESAFGNNWDNARFIVRPMRADELREAVEKPAYKKALYFEPPELIDRLVDEVSQMPGALPLLSFTLSEMYIRLYQAWKDEGAENRALTVAENFEREGGVAGALTRRANEIYDKLPDDAHRLMMRRVMLRMVELEGNEAVRRRVLDSELVYPEEPENKRKDKVLEDLVEARLIVTATDTESNEPYYEPAHDYLVKGWDKLQLWIQREQQQGNLVLQRFLTPAAFDWEQEGQSTQFLWNANPRLDLLKQVLKSGDNWLNAVETHFVQSSIRRKSFNSRRNWSIAIAVMLGLSGLTIAASIARSEAQRQEIDALREASEGNWLANNQLDALVAILRAAKNIQENQSLQAQNNSQQREEVLQTLRKVVYSIKERDRMNKPAGKLLTVTPEREPLIQNYSSDIRYVDSQGKKIQLPKDFIFDNSPLNHNPGIIYSPNKKLLVTAQEATIPEDSGSIFVQRENSQKKGNVHLWDWETKKRITTFRGHQNGIKSFSFSVDSKILAVVDGKNNIHFWDINKQTKLLLARNFQNTNIIGIGFTPDNQPRIVTTTVENDDGSQTLKLWNLQGKEVSQLYGKNDNLKFLKAIFSADGKTIVIEYGRNPQDKTDEIRLAQVFWWNYLDRYSGSFLRQAYSVPLEEEDIFISVSPDGKELFTTSQNSNIRIWNLKDNDEDKNSKNIWESFDLPDRITQAINHDFNANGQQLVIVNGEGKVYLADVKTKKFDLISQVPGKTIIAKFSPDGELLATVNQEGSVGLLNLNNRNFYNLPQKFSISIKSIKVIFSPDRSKLAILATDNDNKVTAKSWQLNPEIKEDVQNDKLNSYYHVFFNSNNQLTYIVQNNLQQRTTLHNLETDVLLQEFAENQCSFQTLYPSQITMSDDKNLIASNSEDVICFWNVETGQELTKLQVDRGESIKDISLSGDGSSIAVLLEDGSIKLQQIGGLDYLFQRGCNHIRDYLENNPNLSESDRNLCAGVVPEEVPEQTALSSEIPVIPMTPLQAIAGDFYSRGQEEVSENVIKKTPKNVDDYINKGVAYFRLINKYPNRNYIQFAIDHYTQALQMNPTDSQAVQALVNRGIAYSTRSEQDDQNLAINDYNRVINFFNSNYVDAYISRGIAYSALLEPQHNKAINNYKQAIELSKNSDANAYYALGFTFALQAEKNLEAIEAYQKAAKLYRKKGKIYYFQSAQKQIENLQ